VSSFEAALLTACRYAELTRLKCANFNSDSGTLAIRLSKRKLRHVVLTCFAEWRAENAGR